MTSNAPRTAGLVGESEGGELAQVRLAPSTFQPDREAPSEASGLSVLLTTIEAWLALLAFDVVAAAGFKHVHALTRRVHVARRVKDVDTVTPHVCRCVDEACIWYFKQVFCLQRSAVAVWMLRRRGIKSELVIGFRPVPLESHAWVEVNGQVVNDRPQYQKFFTVLERL